MKNLITGGAGFIGCNVSDKLLSMGEDVVIFDNLCREGSEKNLKWLEEKYGDKFKFIKGDISKDLEKLNETVNGVDRIFHFAAQVAVTTSVTDPRTDFEVNALGTFNVLEALRKFAPKASLIYTSTNKVYGGMDDVSVIEGEERYSYKDFPEGISEKQPLDFHSPYGCSKGTGDQYVRDYSRIYGLNTIVFRQSCIYGTRQFGMEDQGWVAWFIIAILTGKKISIYGDGKQVRDILYIDDLVDAYLKALKNIGKTKGQVFNIGGGKDKVISVWEDFRPILEKLYGKKIEVTYGDWRPGDQKIYVSDIRKAKEVFGWEPKIEPKEGIEKLFDWAKENVSLFR